MSVKRGAAASLLLSSLAACGGSGSSSGDPDSGVSSGGDTGVVVPPPPAKLTWRVTVIDEGNAGYDPEIARGPNGIALAWYRRTADQGRCMRLMQNPPVARYEIVYAEESTSFAPEVVATVDLVAREGLALAFDPSGAPNVAYMGGGAGMYRCGGTDAMLATRSGGRWTSQTIDTSGMATPAFQEDADSCARYQNYCNAGAQDTVGPWPALGFAGSAPVVAFRDIHFAFAQDDEEKADLELWWGGQRSTLDATWGGGIYTRFAPGAGGRPAFAHLSPHPTMYGNGIWVLQHDGTRWSRVKASTAVDIGYRLAFAGTGTGRLALAYQPRSGQKLVFMESMDGTTWPADATTVDQRANTGLSPSLAFDGAGDPAIAYYQCGRYKGGSTSDCEVGEDALRYATRKNGAWGAVDVRADAQGVDGAAVALAFDAAGLPAIAFQSIYFDPSDGSVIRQMALARGKAAQ